MNNQAKNFGAPSWFGTSGTTPQPNQPNPMRKHPINLNLEPYPQTQSDSSHFPSHFELLVAQTHYAQAQYAQAQAQAHAHAQAQLQSQAAQSPTHSVVANLHNNANTNVTNVANVANVTNTNVTSTPPATGSGKRSTKRRPAAARGKKRELPEKQVPEKVDAILPESPLYTQLLDFEAQMDAKLALSKFDIQEALRYPPHVMRTLRVYVFNTFSNQTQIIDIEKNNVEEASWSLKMIGRILEDGKDSEVVGTSQGSSPSYPKFSAFFKRITIHLDQNLYPDDHVIIWENARSPIQQDGFEVKRIGDKEFTARIKLEMSNVPEMFMVSPQLSKVLRIEVETRPRIIAALWYYVKSRNLQIQNNPLTFMCDPSLQRAFGVEKMEFEDAVKKLAQHLSPPQPIHLEHQIKLSGNCTAETACYDIQVYVPFTMDKNISAISAGLESQKQIEAFGEVISASIKKVQEHRRRRAFFLSFSQSPEEFINAFITSQSKDLKLVAGDASHNFNQPWVEDAVIRYLNRKAAGGDAPGGS